MCVCVCMCTDAQSTPATWSPTGATCGFNMKTNLCKQAPIVLSKCVHPHGMLMNLQGTVVSNLYHMQPLRNRDEVVAKTGAGLFVNGGNPIYYTSKGTSDNVAKDVQVSSVVI